MGGAARHDRLGGRGGDDRRDRGVQGLGERRRQLQRQAAGDRGDRARPGGLLVRLTAPRHDRLGEPGVGRGEQPPGLEGGRVGDVLRAGLRRDAAGLVGAVVRAERITREVVGHQRAAVPDRLGRPEPVLQLELEVTGVGQGRRTLRPGRRRVGDRAQHRHVQVLHQLPERAGALAGELPAGQRDQPDLLGTPRPGPAAGSTRREGMHRRLGQAVDRAGQAVQRRRSGLPAGRASASRRSGTAAPRWPPRAGWPAPGQNAPPARPGSPGTVLRATAAGWRPRPRSSRRRRPRSARGRPR